jgi:hypothetical protein
MAQTSDPVPTNRADQFSSVCLHTTPELPPILTLSSEKALLPDRQSNQNPGEGGYYSSLAWPLSALLLPNNLDTNQKAYQQECNQPVAHKEPATRYAPSPNS